ncbi:uncharacterized protein PAE49_003705 [Odontesthes bonariensis]|uniref:uncharacterized protein LOC142378239 n=1 Tax=Odontesthes bonariensis TaxID=219752 RepID=UPI003F583378
MLLHACLLLLVITTTDKTLASSDHHCGGNVSLDQEAAGPITLTLPGRVADASTPEPMSPPSDRTLQLSACTWVLDVPLGRTVLLYLVELESGSNISVRCVWNEGDQALRSKDTALLSGCDRNKATLSWTGTGRFLNAVQLAYYVQEDERSSSGLRSTHQPAQDPGGRPQTGTTFANAATAAQEVPRSTDHPDQGPVSAFGPQSVSSVSSQDELWLHPTSPQQGLPDAGRADRETLPLPEEKPNNGAETSGAARLTDEPMTARTRPHFQHAFSADTESQTVNPADSTPPHTEMSRTDATVSRSVAWLGTEPGDVRRSEATQTDRSASNASVLLTSAPPEMLTRESDAVLIPHGGAIIQTEDEQPFSGRSQRNADGLLTSAATSDPLKSSTKPPQHDSSNSNADTKPTPSSSSSLSQGPSSTHTPTTHISEPDTAAGTAHLHTNQSDSFIFHASAEFKPSDEITNVLRTLSPSTPSQTNSPKSTESLARSSLFMQTATKSTQTSENASVTANTMSSLPASAFTEGFAGSFSTPGPSQTTKVPNSTRKTYTPPLIHTLLNGSLKTDSASVLSLSSSTTTDSSLPSTVVQTQTAFPDDPLTTLASSVTESPAHTSFVDHKGPSESSQPSRSPQTLHHLLLPTSTNIPPTYKEPHSFATAAYPSLLSTIKLNYGHVKVEKGDKFWTWSPGSTTKRVPTDGPSPTLNPSQQSFLALTTSLTSTPIRSSTNSPVFYIVPNQPAAIRVEFVELLLQIVVEESRSALTAGLEEETAAWVVPYLQRAPGFTKVLGAWSSGHAVQSLIEFKTSGALQWLGTIGPISLLERTGLAQAVRQGRMFRSSKITNVTLGGLQGDVCGWLLQCPAGYKCVLHAGTGNYSCSSVCHSDYCHHHGICTHHPGQPPVCRCLVGDDFWYMGQRCDTRMTRARLVGACLAVLLIVVMVIGILAFVAVRRYRDILIQAKVDQTRSSYRRFNHFDELSGRFWLRSWAGSADSLDNPAFMRSDDLLHLRALDRPCCYHDDTLSLASTCPSHGAHINTIYPHSSQYGWRGSEMSMGDGVLDSGKASDLSVCSWPVEPIHWTPFPLLQQLASHRTPSVRLPRPRSYCEGMELVDLGKSWTA